MLDALNSLVSFFNLIVSAVSTIVDYFWMFFQFLGKGLSLIWSLVETIPEEFIMFPVITVTITVVMLVLGRSNNSG